MQRILLGNTDITVSPVGLGCLNFGSKNDRNISYQLLDQYCNAGGNFLDTANNYAFWNEGCVGGESESLLGKWMRERNNRSQIILATKGGAKPTYPGGGFDHIEGLSQRALERALDESLTRLRTDYIDVYYTHIDDKNIRLEETIETLNRFVMSGKVRAIGCSNYPQLRLHEALTISKQNNWTAFSCIQQRYTYLKPNPHTDFGLQVVADEQLLSYCHDHNIAVLAYSPLLGGSYTQTEHLPSAYKESFSTDKEQILLEIATQIGGTINQVVLAWMMRKPLRVIPLISASTSQQLAENLGSLHIQLSDEHMERLNSID